MPGKVHSLELVGEEEGGSGWGRKVDGWRKLQVAGSLYLQTLGAGLELAGNSLSDSAFCIRKV